MDLLRAIVALVLPAAAGIALVACLARTRAGAPVAIAWTLGAGSLAGLFALTLWMRVLAALGVPFGIATIGLPFVAATLALAVVARRRGPAVLAVPQARVLPPLARAAWFALLAWMLLRYALLWTEVVLRPVFPWEAWIQWATKAQVYAAQRGLAPFMAPDGWLAASGTAWSDAAPALPATLPLLQAWIAIAVGRFDEALIGLPWWLALGALAAAAWGALREGGLAPLGALAGTWFATSLPLQDAHVALAGLADAMVATLVTVAVLALLRWRDTRAAGDALVAIALAAAATSIRPFGALAVTLLLPAVVAAWRPRLGGRVAGGALALALLALGGLARTGVGGNALRLDYAPAWSALVDSLFLLGNWNLLWYGVLVAALAGVRVARAPALLPMSLAVAALLCHVAALAAFPQFRELAGDLTSVNRALLVVAPLAALWMTRVGAAWLATHAGAASPSPDPDRAPAAPPVPGTDPLPPPQAHHA